MTQSNQKTAEANMDKARFGVLGTDKDGNSTITFTRNLPHPIEKVWRAITVAEHRAAWFPELTLAHNVGGAAVVNFSGSDCPAPEDNPDDVDFCTVTRFEPPNVLEYIGAGEHHRFELVEDGPGCILTFLATVPTMDAFDDDKQTIQSRYSVSCGWHYKLDVMEWDLDGVPFEDEGYAGPIKTQYYIQYLKSERNSNK